MNGSLAMVWSLHKSAHGLVQMIGVRWTYYVDKTYGLYKESLGNAPTARWTMVSFFLLLLLFLNPHIPYSLENPDLYPITFISAAWNDMKLGHQGTQKMKIEKKNLF